MLPSKSPCVPFPIYSCGSSDPLCIFPCNKETQEPNNAEENNNSGNPENSTDDDQLLQGSGVEPQTGSALERSTSSGGGALSAWFSLYLLFMVCHSRGRRARRLLTSADRKEITFRWVFQSPRVQKSGIVSSSGCLQSFPKIFALPSCCDCPINPATLACHASDTAIFNVGCATAVRTFCPLKRNL